VDANFVISAHMLIGKHQTTRTASAGCLIGKLSRTATDCPTDAQCTPWRFVLQNLLQVLLAK
jgi:hypothetical protein